MLAIEGIYETNKLFMEAFRLETQKKLLTYTLRIVVFYHRTAILLMAGRTCKCFFKL